MTRPNNPKGRRVLAHKAPAEHPATIAGAVGFNEAAAGMPLAYDRYPCRIVQGAYEVGRLMALNLKAAGAKRIPVWPVGNPMPRALYARLATSLRKVGGFQPGKGDGRQCPT